MDSLSASPSSSHAKYFRGERRSSGNSRSPGRESPAPDGRSLGRDPSIKVDVDYFDPNEQRATTTTTGHAPSSRHGSVDDGHAQLDNRATGISGAGSPRSSGANTPRSPAEARSPPTDARSQASVSRSQASNAARGSQASQSAGLRGMGSGPAPTIMAPSIHGGTYNSIDQSFYLSVKPDASSAVAKVGTAADNDYDDRVTTPYAPPNVDAVSYNAAHGTTGATSAVFGRGDVQSSRVFIGADRVSRVDAGESAPHYSPGAVDCGDALSVNVNREAQRRSPLPQTSQAAPGVAQDTRKAAGGVGGGGVGAAGGGMGISRDFSLDSSPPNCHRNGSPIYCNDFGDGTNVNFVPEQQYVSKKGNLPPRAPGMMLDRKDTLCGNLIAYTVGEDNSNRLSGTTVPGIRMDGAKEGVYGMLAQKGAQAQRYAKEFIGCFAGYFNTMGGNLPECPDPCPPEYLNVNFNAHNPLKKSGYDYEWLIRAGFLPESVDALDLLDDSECERWQPATTSTSTATEFETTNATTAKPLIGINSEADTSVSTTTSTISRNQNNQSASDNANQNANQGAKKSASPSRAMIAITPAPSRRNIELTRDSNGDKKTEGAGGFVVEGAVSSEDCGIVGGAEESSGNEVGAGSKYASRKNSGFVNVVDEYRGRIEDKLQRSRMRRLGWEYANLPRLQDELRLRRRHQSLLSNHSSNSSIHYSMVPGSGGEIKGSASKSAAASKKASSSAAASASAAAGMTSKEFGHSKSFHVDQVKRNAMNGCKERNWIPRPASGML